MLDSLDGRVARLTKTQSAFGAEFDSLADMVSFGAAPALVMYEWVLRDLGKLGWVAAFLYCAGAALRLARFNTMLDVADKRWFTGIPSPAAAALVAGFVWIMDDYDIDPQSVRWWALFVTVFAGLTMVSNLKYWSFKAINLRKSVPFVVGAGRSPWRWRWRRCSRRWCCSRASSPTRSPGYVVSAWLLLRRGRPGDAALSAGERVAPRIAVLVPCYNEALTVAKVVADFSAALPGCDVYVYDNRSSDGTGDIARNAGAVVRREERPGKGGVMRRMFAEIDADIYVVTDGDATYDATRAPEMVERLRRDDLDVVTGVRDHGDRDAAYRRGHQFGNRAFNCAARASCSASGPTDMFSGYRAMSRRFVKSFPAEARGFEIETELTVHALELRVPDGGSRDELLRAARRLDQQAVDLQRRHAHPLHDGAAVPRRAAAAVLLRIRGRCSPPSGSCSAPKSWSSTSTTGLVPRLPTAVLATGLMLLASLSVVCGMILDSVARGRREAKRLAYLAAARSPTPDSAQSGRAAPRPRNVATSNTHACRLPARTA